MLATKTLKITNVWHTATINNNNVSDKKQQQKRKHKQHVTITTTNGAYELPTK